MVVAVVCDVENFAGAGDGGFEAMSRDDEVRGDAAVGPTAYTEFFRIGMPWREGVSHHGHVVLEILLPQSAKMAHRILAVAGKTRAIRKKDGVAVGGEKFRFAIEGSGVWPTGPHEDGGVSDFFLQGRNRRVCRDAATMVPSFAFEMDVFGFGQAGVGNQRVVVFCEAGEIASIRKIDFVGRSSMPICAAIEPSLPREYAAAFWRAVKGR